MSMSKVIFITGITGQDGYYLSKSMLEKGNIVHGTIRRSSLINTKRIDDLISEYSAKDQLYLHYSDLLDSASIARLINKILPDEIYNLAAQSHVAVSFKNPLYSTQTGTLGALSILEAIKSTDKDIKFYQASSSEMYGGEEKILLNENSLFDPKSPYAASKVFAHDITKIYRESYNLFGVNGILFNHESPMRGETFVTRKISRAVGRIKMGIQTKLVLGNLDASRDWGFAGHYVEGLWMMLQRKEPSDWVLATGESITVKSFVEKAFEYVGLNFEDFVESSERYFRPNEVDFLLGDYSKAENQLGWKPKTSIDDLIKMMVEEDLRLANREKVLIDENLLKPTWQNPSGS